MKWRIYAFQRKNCKFQYALAATHNNEADLVANDNICQREQLFCNETHTHSSGLDLREMDYCYPDSPPLYHNVHHYIIMPPVFFL